MKQKMDGTFPETRRDNWTRAEAKKVLLRLAVFFFVLWTSHGLLMWLRPLGAHNWFWNMVLGAIVFGVATRLLRPWFKSGYMLKMSDKKQTEIPATITPYKRVYRD